MNLQINRSGKKMTNRKTLGSDLTPAQRRARDAFKETMAQKLPSDAEIAKKAFDDNRERLKGERLAREASVEFAPVTKKG